MINSFIANRRYKKVLPIIKKNSIILDIGTRNGDFVNKFENGIGIDKEGTRNNKLNFNDDSFDVVTMLAVIEHLELEDMIELSREIYRVLKVGGEFILTTPHPMSKSFLEIMSFLSLVNKKDIREHKIYYDEELLREVFNKFFFRYYERFDIFNQLTIFVKR